ncbi:hypothetical protein GGR57DRAFT_513755 [Xylariaceae sp. FL1272]|nr:hypothetical protein GGR57DRAFT_513755 [Xylariaceae sp. FL1272]
MENKPFSHEDARYLRLRTQRALERPAYRQRGVSVRNESSSHHVNRDRIYGDDGIALRRRRLIIQLGSLMQSNSDILPTPLYPESVGGLLLPKAQVSSSESQRTLSTMRCNDEDGALLQRIDQMLREHDALCGPKIPPDTYRSALNLLDLDIAKLRNRSAALPASYPLTQRSEPDPKPALDPNLDSEFFTSLSSHPVGLVHDQLTKVRLKNSGQWVFELPAYRQWYEAKISPLAYDPEGENFLWLQGHLGAGKTMLIAANLQSSLSKDNSRDTAVIYYYFDRSGGDTPYQALSSLLRQLLEWKNIPLPTFLSHMRQHESHATDNTSHITDNENVLLANRIADLFTVQSWFRRVYICLDGLEECEDIVTWMVVLLKLFEIQQIRVIITARPGLIERFTALKIVHKERVIHLEAHNNQDIREYLRSFLESKESGCLADIVGNNACSTVIDKIVDKSGMNYLSAIAQATQLSRLTSRAEITAQLDAEPLQLPEVMHVIISQLNDQSVERSRLARHTFYWLAVARRPLTLRELQQAVVAGSGVKIDDADQIPAPSLIVAVCKGFVHIDLQEDRIFTIPSALPFYFYQFNDEFAEQAREYAARSCHALLTSDVLSHGPFTSQSQYEKMQSVLPFAHYASQHWGIHIEDAGIEEITNEILENGRLLDTLSQLLQTNAQSGTALPLNLEHCPRGFGSHHFAAYFGLTTACSKWTTQVDWAAQPDSWNRSPFQVSFCAPGLDERHALLRTLLEHPSSFYEMLTGCRLGYFGVNTDSSQAGDENTFRHEPVERLPWTWRANMEDKHWYASQHTPLGRNFQNFYDLNKTEMEKANQDGKIPLLHFVAHWDVGIFLTLIEFMAAAESDAGNEPDDADNCPHSEPVPQSLLIDNSGRTLLDYALERDIIFSHAAYDLMHLTLEQLNRSIVVAATCGYTNLVCKLYRQILSSSSETENLGPGQALIEASKRGFIDIVRLIRSMGGSKGVDIKVQDDEGMSPLHHAAYGRHVNTVEFLLIEGSNPNQVDKSGRTPLYCGCEGGSNKVISLLKMKAASVTPSKAEGYTQLHLAAQRGNVDVTRRLLGLDGNGPQLHGKDLETEGSGAQSALHVAAQEGHAAIVSVLIKQGFDINARGIDERTPLSYASEGGHLESVQALLVHKRFLDINCVDCYQRTALSYAAGRGHIPVVAALLGSGEADPNIQDDFGKTALMHAAEGGHIDTVVVLTLLANRSDEVGEAAENYFGTIYSQYSALPSGSTPVDVNLEDNEGRSAVIYLQQRDGKEISDLVEYLESIS